jgi:hypothetical protein
LAIPVALEPDCLGVHPQFLDQLRTSVSLAELISDNFELLGEGGRDDCHGKGCILRGSKSPKLELIASVGIRTGSVAVSVLLVDVVGQTEYLSFQVFFGLGVLSIDNGANGLSEVGGDDAGRRLVSSQPHFVPGWCNRAKVEGVIAFKGHEGGQDE